MDPERWRQIERIYDMALNLPPDERKNFIKNACPEDESIRREVERLVEHQNESEDYFESPAIEALAGIETNIQPSPPWDHLGPYKILTVIGRGGMGEVYRAHDQKLGRDVAIKILPEEFSRDVSRISRFQREAKLLASLNHPNIESIHGFEEINDTRFIILELVEGETLADKIRKDSVRVEEALKLALQIAEALEAAHKKGVIHRDLKPANIKVTPEGKVKLLDFGLAKSFDREHQGIVGPSSPPVETSATLPGVVIGTASYMSPEQARGNAVDERTDIWSFGCLLYEMLTGHSTFPGESITDVLAAVILSEPDWSKLPPDLHWKLREVLKRCLQKDSKDRYDDISMARLDIQSTLDNPQSVPVRPLKNRMPGKIPWSRVLWMTLPAVLCVLIAVSFFPYLKSILQVSDSLQVIYFSYDMLPGQYSGAPNTLAVSPDGRLFVYSATNGLFLRSMERKDIRIIPGTDEKPQSPFFSPDGKWIGYFSESARQLKKISVGGGVPLTICSVQNISGTHWNEEDEIIYAALPSGIMRVPADGGLPELLFEGIAGHPQLLPDGKSILFTLYRGSGLDGNHRIMVHSLESGESIPLMGGGEACRYLPTGHLVYWLENRLFAVPFNLKTLEITGGPVTVLEGVQEWAVSNTGTLLYLPAATSMEKGPQTLVWVDRQGKEEAISAPGGSYGSPQISPDGTRVVFTLENRENSDIWIFDFTREVMMRLTFNEDADSYPIWTPNGKHIIFHSSRALGARGISDGIYRKAGDGTGEVEPLASIQDRILIPSSFTADGNLLMMMETRLEPFQTDIGYLSMKGEWEFKRLTQNRHIKLFPKISPDGQWIAYSSNESGRHEVYVRPFPEASRGKWQLSSSGGISPLWSPDGKELFYRSGNSTFSVPVETGRQFRAGNPRLLFSGSYSTENMLQSEHTPWNIHPDGKRFLMIKDHPATETIEDNPQEIHVIYNWLEELKQRVPAY